MMRTLYRLTAVLLLITLASHMDGQGIYIYRNGEVDTKLFAKDADSYVIIDESRDLSVDITNRNASAVNGKVKFTFNLALGSAIDKAEMRVCASYSDTLGSFVPVTKGRKTVTLDIPSDIMQTGYIQIRYSAPYTDEMTTSFEFTYINSLGYGTFTDTFWDEKAFSVQIYRDPVDTSVYYVSNPYKEIIGLDNSTMPKFLNLKLLNVGDTVQGYTVTSPNLVYFDYFSTGYYYASYGQYVYVHHPYDFSKSRTEEGGKYNRVESYQSDGVTPASISLAPYYYMPGIGGWNYTTVENCISIIFPDVSSAKARTTSKRLAGKVKVSGSHVQSIQPVRPDIMVK